MEYKQVGIFECKIRGEGKSHLIDDSGACQFCGMDERTLELAFESDEQE